MATPIQVPRINNNDDEVKLVGLEVQVGASVLAGQIVGQVETEKSVVDVEAPAAGYVLAVRADVGDTIAVGSVLLWLGEQADEAIPADPAALSAAGAPHRAGLGQATAKAAMLLRQYGLSAGAISCGGDRVTVADVERHLAAHRVGRPEATTQGAEQRLDTPGELRELRADERAMLSTVQWQRDFAATGYIELEFDPAPWDAYAKAFAERGGLMLSPLLALMAWRLVEICVRTPTLNATIVGQQRFEYANVNLGFTVHAGETLYLAVLRDAAALGESGFVNALGDIQRRAIAHKLRPQETQGATVGFSSMARWKVSRHVPLLAPGTALMIAHAAATGDRAVLGASYDHRVLNGFQVATALRQLSKPPTH